MKKLDPLEAARQLIHQRFPHCKAAVLAGSIVRGEATQTSDLDLVIFSADIPSSYRESLFYAGWPVETFIHNLTSYKIFFKRDCDQATPSMPRMISEGIVLKDSGIINSIKKEAEDLIMRGPEMWTDETIKLKQYYLTDVLDDLIGSRNRTEEIFIAGRLAELAAEFVLRTNRQWTGKSKWMIRSLSSYDPGFTEQFADAFDLFFRTGEKDKVIEIVDRVLQPYGGRLFDGFYLGSD
ncbi:nucleotidyltransferase domain-containing protein [Halobacillus massiliensis]|uniref:nucleotidyltransferase domain-containing protein n=1 Tax=Halobacillus massiliensis TaxID=1926286 RepID=UPI00117A4A12|nr:nucleotidyltransferase domain-containing protein [Halobacillus massiliensis]